MHSFGYFKEHRPSCYIRYNIRTVFSDSVIRSFLLGGGGGALIRTGRLFNIFSLKGGRLLEANQSIYGTLEQAWGRVIPPREIPGKSFWFCLCFLYGFLSILLYVFLFTSIVFFQVFFFKFRLFFSSKVI